MAKGSDIIVSGQPRGVQLEGIIEGTPKPGTVMQIKAATAADGTGRHTWQVYNADADGNQRIVAVLLPDYLQGVMETTAYTTGTRGFLYFPLPGEELNMLAANLTGTGSGTDDAFAVGDLLIVDDGTGKLIKTTGSPESEPFLVLEAVAALTEDTLIWCLFTGY